MNFDEIVNVQYYPVNKGNVAGNILCYIQVGELKLISFKATLINGSKGKFVSYPADKVGNEYYEKVKPISKEFSVWLSEKAIALSEEGDNDGVKAPANKPTQQQEEANTAPAKKFKRNF